MKKGLFVLIIFVILIGVFIGVIAGTRIARSNSFYEMVKFSSWNMKETTLVEIKMTDGTIKTLNEEEYPFLLSSSFSTLPLKKVGKGVINNWKYRIILKDAAINVPPVEILIGDEGLSVDGDRYATFRGTAFSTIMQYFDNTFNAPHYEILYEAESLRTAMNLKSKEHRDRSSCVLLLSIVR